MIVDNLFCLMSDLHGEFLNRDTYREELSNYIAKQRCEASVEINTVVLAGDVAPAFHPRLPEILREIKSHFSRVIYIPGNHEYYQTGGERKDVNSQWENLQRVCREEGVTLLDRGVEQLNSETVLMGCTMWFKHDPVEQGKCKINDRFEICESGGTKPFLPEMRFQKDVQWMEETMMEMVEGGKKVIIVTHHLPLGKDIFNYLNRPPISYPYTFQESSGFTTDMSDFIRNHRKNIQAWCFGHTHTKLHFKDPFSGCQFYANPYGYPFENKTIKGR